MKSKYFIDQTVDFLLIIFHKIFLVRNIFFLMQTFLTSEWVCISSYLVEILLSPFFFFFFKIFVCLFVALLDIQQVN